MYQRILVPIDGSATSQRGLQEAIRLARVTQATLRLVHIVDELSFSLAASASWGYTGGWLDVLRESGAKILESGVDAVRAEGIAVEGVLFDSFAGPVHEQVVAEAIAWKADLIVLGTHGRRGVGRVMLGSSAESILRSAPVPVLLVRATEDSSSAATADAAASPADAAPDEEAVTVDLPAQALRFERN